MIAKEDKPKRVSDRKARPPMGLGSFYEEKGLYCWRIRKGQRVIAVVKKNTKGERLEAVLNKIAELRRDGKLLEKGEEPTIRVRYLEWLETNIKPHRAKNTYKSYEETGRNYLFTHPLSEKKPSELTSKDVQSLVNAMKTSGKSGRTIELAVGALCTCLGRRVALEIKDGVTMPRKNPPRKRILRDPDMGVFYGELYRERKLKSKGGVKGSFVEPAYRDRYTIDLILCIGTRISETLGITLEKVNLDEGYIDIDQQLIRSKDEKGDGRWDLDGVKSEAGVRRLYMSLSGVEAVKGQIAMIQAEKARLGEHYSDHNLLFPTSTGKPGSARNIRRTLEAVVEAINKKLKADGKAEWEDVTLHDLRRSHLTHFARTESRPQIVKQRAGHASINVTFGVYALAEELDSKNSAALLDFGRGQAGDQRP